MSKDLALVLVDSVVATLNPTLLATVLVMLLLPDPGRLMAAYLTGAYTISIAAGLAIAFSLHGSGIASARGGSSPPARRSPPGRPVPHFRELAFARPEGVHVSGQAGWLSA